MWAMPARSRTKLRPKFDLFIGLQSVKDSDYAADLRARVYQGAIGFGFSGSSYVEHAGGPMSIGAGSTVPQTEDVTMDLWSFTLDGKVLRDAADTTQLWLRGGLTGVKSTEFDQIYGPTLGVELIHKLSNNLGVRGSARQYWFEHDVKAREYRAELTASIVSVGYRVLEFNVGERLHGPTAGLNVRF